MTRERSDLDRVLAEWMNPGPTSMPDRVVDVVADRIADQPQRRWRLVRSRPMPAFVKPLAAAAAAIVVVVVAWQLLPGSGGPGGDPSPTPSPSPSTVPTTVAESTPRPLSAALTAGRYQMEFNGLTILADVPADVPSGWSGDPAVPYIDSGEGFGSEQVFITFMETDSLYSDGCHWDLDGTALADQPGDVEVGPTVDDLVDALRANTSYTSTTPVAVTFGAYEGRELELQLPSNEVIAACDIEAGDTSGVFYVFSNTGILAQGSENRWRLSIVDVEGIRLIVLLSYFEGTDPADLEAAQAIVDSFEFTP